MDEIQPSISSVKERRFVLRLAYSFISNPFKWNDLEFLNYMKIYEDCDVDSLPVN